MLSGKGCGRANKTWNPLPFLDFNGVVVCLAASETIIIPLFLGEGNGGAISRVVSQARQHRFEVGERAQNIPQETEKKGWGIYSSPFFLILDVKPFTSHCAQDRGKLHFITKVHWEFIPFWLISLLWGEIHPENTALKTVLCALEMPDTQCQVLFDPSWNTDQGV